MGSDGEATFRGLVLAVLVLLVLFVAGFATGVALAQDTGPALSVTTPAGPGDATPAGDRPAPLLR